MNLSQAIRPPSVDCNASLSLERLHDFVTHFISERVGLTADSVSIIRENLKSAIESAEANQRAGGSPDLIRGQRIGAYTAGISPGFSPWRKGHYSLTIDCGGSAVKCFLKYLDASGKINASELFRMPSVCDENNLSAIKECHGISPTSLKSFDHYFKFFVAQVSSKLAERGVVQSAEILTLGLVWSNPSTAQSTALGLDALTGSQYSKGEDYTRNLAPGLSLLTKFRDFFAEQNLTIDFGAAVNDTEVLSSISKNVSLVLVMATGFNVVRYQAPNYFNTELGVAVELPQNCFKDPRLFKDKDVYNLQDLIGLGTSSLPLMVGKYLAELVSELVTSGDNLAYPELAPQLSQFATRISGNAIRTLISVNEVERSSALEALNAMKEFYDAPVSSTTFEVARLISWAVLKDSIKVVAAVIAEFVSELESPKVIIDSIAARQNDLFALDLIRSVSKELEVRGSLAKPILDFLIYKEGDYRANMSAPALALSLAINNLIARDT